MAKLVVAKVFGLLDCGRSKVLPFTFKVLPPLSKHFPSTFQQRDESDKIHSKVALNLMRSVCWMNHILKLGSLGLPQEENTCKLWFNFPKNIAEVKQNRKKKTLSRSKNRDVSGLLAISVLCPHLKNSLNSLSNNRLPRPRRSWLGHCLARRCLADCHHSR